MKRLIDIVIFLAKRNLAFKWSNKILGSPPNGNFFRFLEILTERNSVSNKLQNRIIRHKPKQHYFSKDTQNELINLIARKAEKVLLTQHKQAKHFAVILDCTPDISHREQLTVILHFVQCADKSGAIGKEVFFGLFKSQWQHWKRLAECLPKTIRRIRVKRF